MRSLLPPSFVPLFSWFLLSNQFRQVVPQIRCSRCSQRTARPSFPAFACEITGLEGSNGINTPGGEFGECECQLFDGSPIRFLRFPFECDIRTSDPFDVCRCRPEYSAICEPSKCDFAYECGDTMYVCWDVIDPESLGIEADTCDNDGLVEVKYCTDTLDHPYVPTGTIEICGFICDSDRQLLAGEITKNDLIGNADICPNGQTITRITEFCAPSGNTGTSNCDVLPVFSGCDLSFCDWGPGREWNVLPKTTAPVTVECPSSIVTTTQADSCSALVTYPSVIATSADTCRNNVEQRQTSGLPSGSLFPVGATANIFHDSYGQVTCSFLVVVSDTTTPTSDSCPVDIGPVSTQVDTCSAIVDLSSISASGTCASTSGLTFPLGTTPIVFDVTDATTNEPTICTFNVVVEDRQSPSITCPSAIQVNTAPRSCTSAAIPYDARFAVTDNCSGSIQLHQTLGRPSGSSFDLGSTANTFVATDVALNENTCTFAVTVVDAEPPVVSCSMTRTCSHGGFDCTFLVVWSATDNCAADLPLTIVTAHVESECFPSIIPVTSQTQTLDYLSILKNNVETSNILCPANGGTNTAKLVLNVMDGAGNVATCESVASFGKSGKNGKKIKMAKPKKMAIKRQNRKGVRAERLRREN
jgi:hypothetical protein